MVLHRLRLKMKVLRSVGSFIMACLLLFSSGCGKSTWSSQTMTCCLVAMVDGMSLNAASRAFGLPKPTLRRHRLGMNKYASDDVKYMCGPLSLSAAVEDELVKHVKDLDDMMFGMTAKDLLGLACEVSVAHGILKEVQSLTRNTQTVIGHTNLCNKYGGPWTLAILALPDNLTFDLTHLIRMHIEGKI